MNGIFPNTDFKQVFVEESASKSDVSERLKKYFGSVQIIADDSLNHQSLSYDDGKEILLLKNHKGAFFKRCPGASQKKSLACCNYFILNLGSGCNLNCSYCYLQSYLKNPVTTIYANIDQAIQELQEMSVANGHLPFRVGTGEIVDSLSLDPLTGYSQKLIQFFKTVPNWKLEFKTKTNLVDQFLDADHGGNVIVSWSINAHHVVQSEEHKTNSLKERLDAAQKCRDRGFLISFHIDPLIYFEGWQQGYRQLVDEITNRFKPEDLLVLSIGALRFTKDQIAIMRHRFAPDSLVNQAEVFSSDTGKYRYDQRIRQKMFSFVVNAFKDHSPDWNTFLCMETPESWISTYDSMPGRIEPLKDFFRPLPKIKMPTEQQPQY